jgi:hypothetical protein
MVYSESSTSLRRTCTCRQGQLSIAQEITHAALTSRARTKAISGRSFLPERISQYAVGRSVSGMQQGATKNVAVISGDVVLKWKHVWSQVAAELRSPFRQKGPT